MIKIEKSLSRDFLVSIIFHLLLIGLCFVVPVGRTITPKVSTAAAGSAHVKDIASAESSKSIPVPALTQDLVRANVENKLKSMISGELLFGDEQKLLQAAGSSLEKLASSIQSGDDIAQATEDLQGKVLEELKTNVDEMAKEAISAEIATQLDGNIYDQVKDRIEQGINGGLGEEIRSHVEFRLSQERKSRYDKFIAEIEQSKKALTALSKNIDDAATKVSSNQLPEAEKLRAGSQLEFPKTSEALRQSLTKVPEIIPDFTVKSKELQATLDAASVQPLLEQAGKALASNLPAESLAKLNESKTALQGQIDSLSQFQTELKNAKNAPDSVTRALASESLEPLEDLVKEQLSKESLKDLNNRVEDKLVKSMAQRASRFNMDEKELKKLISDLVSRRLAENLKERKPQTGGVLNLLRDGTQLLSPEKMDEALASTEKAAAALRTIRDRQAALEFSDRAVAPGDLSLKQAAINQEYEKVGPLMDEMREKTNLASNSAAGLAVKIGASERNNATRSKLQAMSDLLRVDRRQQAGTMKDSVVKNMDERLQQLSDLGASLKKEQERVKSYQNALKASQIDPKLLEAMRQGIKSDVQTAAKKSLPSILGRAGDVLVESSPALDIQLEEMAGLVGKAGQFAENAAAGRSGSGLDDLVLGGMAPGVKGAAGTRFLQFNSSAIERFGKDLRERSNPDKYYGEVSQTENLASVAAPVSGQQMPLYVVVPPTPELAQETKIERKVPDPAFKTVAFASAAMMEHPVVIDGDLSDWGQLQHPIPTQFRSDGTPSPEPTNVYVRWSPEGLYIAYFAKKEGAVVPGAFKADCMELWVDGENLRAPKMTQSQFSQQFFLAPFGYPGKPNATFVEVGRGLRGLDTYKPYIDESGKLGHAAGKIVPGGYTVEVFITRKAIARPNFVPGAYLAFNFSVNRGPRIEDWEQWSASKAHATWDRPDTWGDLLLLGSDGKPAFVDPEDFSKPPAMVAPGGILTFTIQDKDMDLNYSIKDRIPAVLRVKGSDIGLFVVLEETAASSGIFVGSVNTQHREAPPVANTLNVRGGDYVELVYTDARAEFGETNREEITTYQIAAPVMILSSK